MVFCNHDTLFIELFGDNVTILILVDGFLQSHDRTFKYKYLHSHNPYFSRWFSAITAYFKIQVVIVKSQSLF